MIDNKATDTIKTVMDIIDEVRNEMCRDYCKYVKECSMLQMLWLLEEYEEPKEPEVDWSKVAVDTPILVRQGKSGRWFERHFAKYENGDVYAWVDGRTSWTGATEAKWTYAKLADMEGAE